MENYFIKTADDRIHAYNNNTNGMFLKIFSLFPHPWCRVFLKVTQLVKIFPAFTELEGPLTIFTKA